MPSILINIFTYRNPNKEDDIYSVWGSALYSHGDG